MLNCAGDESTYDELKHGAVSFYCPLRDPTATSFAKLVIIGTS